MMLETEKYELDRGIYRLEYLVRQPLFSTFSKEKQALLYDQLYSMHQYSTTLGKLIKLGESK